MDVFFFKVENEDDCGGGTLPMPIGTHETSGARMAQYTREAATPSLALPPPPMQATSNSCQFNVSTDQESLVRHFIDRQKFTEVGQAVVIEWRQLAAAVDRILFWVFCIITCVSSALFLLIIPGYNRGWFSRGQQF